MTLNVKNMFAASLFFVAIVPLLFVFWLSILGILTLLTSLRLFAQMVFSISHKTKDPT